MEAVAAGHQSRGKGTGRAGAARAGRRVAAGLLALFLVGAASAQINVDAYRDYLLVGQFGELCTMCEAVVLCREQEPQGESVPDSGDFALYHLQTRTFWSQMSTIWEWFITNFTQEGLAARGHTRPAHVYRVANGEWSPREVIEARLVLSPGVLRIGEHSIDRVSRAWSNAETGAELGHCARLPLWDALESIEENAPGGHGES